MRQPDPMKWACLCGLIAVIGCDRADLPAETDNGPFFAAPPFTLTDQDGQPFGSEQLKGKVWIVTLFYTSCPGPCPMMTGRLKKIQDKLDDPHVEMVSVSVDPDHDTPAKMKDYANAVGAKVGRWAFLTGTPAQVQQVADGLKLGYEPAAANAGQIVHATKFLLVDKAGQVRGVYHTDDNDSMTQLQTDAEKLAK